MMALNLGQQHLLLRAISLPCALLAGTSALAQDLSVPPDPVAAIEGDWNGIWEDWSVSVTNGRVVLTKGDPKTYSWLPVGTVLGVLNNNGKSEPRAYRFSGSTCLDHQRDQSPSQYQTIPCGDFGAVLTVYADSYELKVSGISLRRPKNAKEHGPNKRPASKATPSAEPAAQGDKPVAEKARNAARPFAERQNAREATEQRYREEQSKYEADLAEQQRKVAEFERAKEDVARKKAEQQVAAQRAQDSFAAEQAAHAEELLRNQQQVREYERKLAEQANNLPSKGGKFQATSAIVDTREAAMAALMRQSLPGPLTDIRCDEVKMFSPPKWTCWGFYRANVKPQSATPQ